MSNFNCKEVEKILRYEFQSKPLLEKAFTHRSYLNETDDKGVSSNERLEFLGDAVLQYLTSRMIFDKYQIFPEGELTNLRSRLVNTDSLANETERLKLANYLLVSKGEKETATESSYIMADLFEAIVGAILIDSDLTQCQKFLNRELFYKTKAIVEQGSLKDAKSLFQEFAQEKYSITPTYKTLSDEGPDHDKTFTVAAFLEKKKFAEGSGSSKRKAERTAAENALKTVRKQLQNQRL